MMNIEIEQLLAKAREAYRKAYAPYSHFQVGCALLTRQGNIFVGCNVENVSYGLTICAERNAIAAAVVGEGGDLMTIEAIAILNNRGIPCSPCGACRQVIAEFGKKAIVIFQGQKTLQTIPLEQLLPEEFSLSDSV